MSFSDVALGRWCRSRIRLRSGGRRLERQLPQAPVSALPIGEDGLFWPLVRKIESGELNGRQCDWGCWVAQATREQVTAFVDEVYADVFPDDAIRELRSHIDGLDPGRTYLLVAAES